MARPTNESILAPYRYTQDGPESWMPVFSSHTYPILSRTYSGSTTPDYLTKKKKRMLPDLPYSSNLIRCYGRATLWTLTNSGHSVDTLGVHYTGVTPLDGQFPSLVTDATNKATLRLYKKVDGVKLNVAQFFAERKQTAELFASTANRIRSAVRSLRRANFREFANSLSLSGTEKRTAKQTWSMVQRTPPERRVASHWLEYVYGWRPLLQDCFDAAELLAEQVSTYEPAEGQIIATASVKADFKSSPEAPQGATGGVILLHRADNHSCKARIRVNYRLDEEARSLLNKTGISNPALLAWELLPYSFVVDWFVPVGTYLESLTAMDGFTIASGTISTLEKAGSSRTLTFENKPGGETYTEFRCEGFPVTSTQVRYKRTLQTSFPYALKVKSPIGGEPLTRFATAASLLYVLFGRAPSTSAKHQPSRA